MDYRDHLDERNRERMITQYEEMPARNVREIMENTYDRVCDTLKAVTVPVRLPVALFMDVFVGVFGRHYAGNEHHTLNLFATRKRHRALQRYLDDLVKAETEAREKLKKPGGNRT